MRFNAVLIALAVLTTLACGSKREAQHHPPRDAPESKPTEKDVPDRVTAVANCDLPLVIPSESEAASATAPGILSCPPANCGGNSPVVNGFPINGLRARCKNSEGVRLVAGSLRVAPGQPSQCNGRELNVNEKGMLYAPDAQGNIDVCKHEKLKGASFGVEVIGPSGSLTTSIRINETGFVKIPPMKAQAYAYEFTSLGSDESLCTRKAAALWREHVGLRRHEDDVEDSYATKGPSGTMIPHAFADDGKPIRSEMAIVRKGELYKKDLNQIAEAGYEHWFTLACARDTLAKIDLFDIAKQLKPAPGNESEYVNDRKSAIRMLTANYCGEDTKRAHYTVEGTEISWNQYGLSKPNGVGPIEAIWGPNGAKCISQARPLLRNWPDGIKKRMMPKECRENSETLCESPVLWTSELRKECRILNVGMTPDGGVPQPLDECPPSPMDTDYADGEMASFSPN